MKRQLKIFGKKSARWLLSLTCLGLVGCVGPRLAERPPELAETQELAYKFYIPLAARNQKIETMRAEASLRMSQGIFSRAMDQYLLVQRSLEPRAGQLRIDSYDPSGQLIAQLVYAEGVLYYSEPQTGYFRSSQDAGKLLREEIGLDVSIDRLVLLLSGGVPLEPRENYLAVAQAGKVLLRGLDSQVEIEEEGGLPFRYVRRLSNGSIYEALFSDYQVINNIWFPIRVEMKASDPEFHVVVTYLGAELNEPIDPNVFAPPVIPVGAGWGE